jgi:hypothetical protein
MKYSVDMGLGVMIYVPRFIKFGWGIQKLLRRDTQTDRQEGDRISLIHEISLLLRVWLMVSVSYSVPQTWPLYGRASLKHYINNAAKITGSCPRETQGV